MDNVNAVIWRTVNTDASLEVASRAGIAHVAYLGPSQNRYYPAAKREEWAHYLPQDLAQAIIKSSRERAAIVQYLMTVRDECYADGDTRYAEFTENLAKEISVGQHYATFQDALSQEPVAPQPPPSAKADS